MKHELQQMVCLPFATPVLQQTLALAELSDLLHQQATPEKLVAQVREGQLDAFLNKVILLTDMAIQEAVQCPLGFITDIRTLIAEKWKLLIRLLDMVFNYLKKHADLATIYQQIQTSLIKTYNVFLQIHPLYCPLDYKMADVHLADEIRYLKHYYERMITKHGDNALLKALLHPVYEISKCSGKSSRTYDVIDFTKTLLANTKLWDKKKGKQEELYQIALAMNVNSKVLMEYLRKECERDLDACESREGKVTALRRWDRLFRNANSKNSWGQPARKGYDTNKASLFHTVRHWLYTQKSLLEQPEPMPEIIDKVEVDGDGAFFSWCCKIATQAGAFKTTIVARVIRVFGKVISLSKTANPNVSNLEHLAKGNTVHWKLKDKLVDYFGKCLNLAKKLEETGTRPPQNNKRRR